MKDQSISYLLIYLSQHDRAAFEDARLDNHDEPVEGGILGLSQSKDTDCISVVAAFTTQSMGVGWCSSQHPRPQVHAYT